MKTLGDLLEHQLKDLYKAEDQLAENLPTMIDKAGNKELKNTFGDHLEKTIKHRNRIKEICDELKVDYKMEKCLPMEVLIEQVNLFMNEEIQGEVMNTGLIFRVYKIQHYKIACYCATIQFAKEMEYDDIAAILNKTLEQEYSTGKKLTKLAEKRLKR